MLVAFCFVGIWLLLGLLFEHASRHAGAAPVPLRAQPYALTFGTAWTLVYALYLLLCLLALACRLSRGRATFGAFLAAEEARFASDSRVLASDRRLPRP